MVVKQRRPFDGALSQELDSLSILDLDERRHKLQELEQFQSEHSCY